MKMKIKNLVVMIIAVSLVALSMVASAAEFTAPAKTFGYAVGEAFDFSGMLLDGAEIAEYTSDVDTATAGAKVATVKVGDASYKFAYYVGDVAKSEEIVKATSFTTEAPVVNVSLNSTVTLTYSVDVDADVKWISLDENVATVDAGVVTGQKIGTTKVIATVAGGLELVYDINVKYPTPTTGIVGRIVEATDTEKGIEGVSVIVYDENEEIVTTVLTDGNGDYAVELPEGFYLLAIEADGYAPRNDFSLYAETIEGEVTTIGLEGYLVLNESLLGDVDNTATVTVDDIFMVMGISNGETEYPTYLEYTDFE